MVRVRRSRSKATTPHVAPHVPATALPEVGTRVPKVRHSGHLVDQKLKYNDPARSSPQLSLFDRLKPELAGEVRKHEVRYEGIRLTPAEDRLLTALYSLLKDKSESKDTDSDRFYRGNYETTEVAQFGGDTLKPAHIRIAPTELYKAYLGNVNYSGKEMRDITKTLESLDGKRFLMTYDRTRIVQVNKGKTESRIDRIERFEKLVNIVKAAWDMTPEEAEQLAQGDDRIREAKGELIIGLHPVLTDQIGTKYVEYPEDINRRTIIAAGGDHRNVTPAINTLRDWLMRELANKRYECQINADKLPYLLKLDRYVEQGRKKLIREAIEKAIQACKSLNLLLDVSESVGAEGQPKYVFKLNPEFA